MERRLTTIVAADLAGYSRLMAIDEEDVIARLGDVRREVVDPAVAEEGGRLFKTMGDGLLIEFGSPVKAVRCALAIQQSMRQHQLRFPEDGKLRFRVGVNLGDVVIDGDDMLGDSVNIASRLETLAPVGGICISRGVYDQVRGRIDAAMTPLGPQSLKNIPEPVEVWQIAAESSKATIASSHPGSGGQQQFIRVLSGIMIVLIVSVGGYAAWFVWGSNASIDSLDHTIVAWDDKPTVAVLPFINQNGNQSQDYFTDGLTEDIITDLSRISGLRVIARQSTFEYKGREFDLQEIGRTLNARYLLQGSVRLSDDKVRVNASLIDIENGTNMWANRYDHTLRDAFELQDEVTRTIVSALTVKLTSEEERYLASSRQVNQDAYEMLLRGLEPLRQFSVEGNLQARDFFERAIELDPDYARAHANLALTYARELVFSYGAHQEESITKAMASADRAESLDSHLTQTHFARAVVYQAQRDHVKAVASSRRTIELDPNYADGHIVLATALLANGNHEEAKMAIARAKALNPSFPFSYIGVEGQYHFLTGEFEQAAKAFGKSLERNPAFAFGRLYLIACYGHLGLLDEAAWELEEFLALRPDYSLEQALKESLYRRSEDTQILVDGLKMAGLN